MLDCASSSLAERCETGVEALEPHSDIAHQRGQPPFFAFDRAKL